MTDKLAERGHKVNVLSPRLGNMDFGTTPLYLGHPLMLTTIKNFKLLNRLYNESDVIVCPDNDLLPFLCFLSHWKQKPLMSNTHTNFRMVLEGGSWIARNIAAPVMDNACKLCSHLASETWTTSPSYKEVLDQRGYNVKGVFSPRIKLGVFEKKGDTQEDIETARKWLMGGVDAKFVMISAGRWSHEKRIHLLTEALPDDCVLCIVGDGPANEAEKIEKLHDPSKKVIVHRGMVNQERLRVLYKASDFLLSASAFETLGMTVAEAHVCGTPVIVQSAPGFVTQVVEGVNGFLVDFEDKNIKNIIAKYLERAPTRKQVLNSVNDRWDSSLPNLEDAVEELATKTRRSDWDCLGSMIPMPLWWIFIIIYFFVYRIISWPFIINKETGQSNVVEPGQAHKGKKVL